MIAEKYLNKILSTKFFFNWEINEYIKQKKMSSHQFIGSHIFKWSLVCFFKVYLEPLSINMLWIASET